MEIESLTRYLAAMETQATTIPNTAAQQTNASLGEASTDMDTYESTISASTNAIPCDTYSDIMELIKATKQANGEAEGAPTEENFAAAIAQLTEAEQNSENIQSSSESSQLSESSGDGSGSSSESEDSSTTTETVISPDGSVYLKTTTTSADGEQTVSITKISDGNLDKPDKETTFSTPFVNADI